ncbi:MAG: DUF4330 domain-containing protein [Spirulinaceae cyanobacterium]
MKILDSQGRLFGKISIIDLGAALVILAVIIGIFIFPGTSGSIAQVTKTQPVEVDVVVRGLSVAKPEELLEQFSEEKTTKLSIRNEAYGDPLEIKSVEELERLVVVPQPDGSVKALPDPRKQEDALNVDLLMTLGGEGQITETGVVLGPNKIKIGTTVELEGNNYNFNASVIDVRVEEE